MRSYVGDALPALLRGPVMQYRVVVDAWRQGVLEIPSVPILAGTATWTGTLLEACEISLQLPATPELVPDSPRHPLSPYGQELMLAAVVEGGGHSIRIPLGRFRIVGKPKVNGNTIDLTVRDRGVNLEGSRLVTPTAYGPVSPSNPDAGRRYYLTRLVRAVTPVFIESTDSLLGSVMTPMRDRLEALEDMLEAWSSRARWDAGGALIVYPEPSPTRDPVLTITDGEGGTLVSVDPSPAPSAEFNACIVQGSSGGGRSLFGGAYVQEGPMAWPNTDPDSVYGMRPGFYFSPLLKTVPACVAAAKSILARWQRGVNGTVAVSMAPDPRLEVGDKVAVSKGGVTTEVELTSVQLPLTSEGGPMELEGAIL